MFKLALALGALALCHAGPISGFRRSSYYVLRQNSGTYLVNPSYRIPKNTVTPYRMTGGYGHPWRTTRTHNSRRCSTRCNQMTAKKAYRYSYCRLTQNCYMFNNGLERPWQTKHNVNKYIMQQLKEWGASPVVKGQDLRRYGVSFNWMHHFCSHASEYRVLAQQYCGNGNYRVGTSTTYGAFGVYSSYYTRSCMYKLYSGNSWSTRGSRVSTCLNMANRCKSYLTIGKLYMVACANTKAAWFINRYEAAYKFLALAYKQTAVAKAETTKVAAKEAETLKETAKVATRVKGLTAELESCESKPIVGKEFAKDMKYTMFHILRTVQNGTPKHWDGEEA